jgi:hypothetical protein
MAILGLAGAALAFDKVVLGGGAPSSASAATTLVEEEPPASPAVAAPDPAARVEPLESRLAQALDGAGQAADLSDAFCAPEAWLAKPDPQVPVLPSGQIALEMTMLTTTAARINKQVILVGQTLGEITLIAVDTQSQTAEVEVGGERRVVGLSKSHEQGIGKN